MGVIYKHARSRRQLLGSILSDIPDPPSILTKAPLPGLTLPTILPPQPSLDSLIQSSTSLSESTTSSSQTSSSSITTSSIQSQSSQSSTSSSIISTQTAKVLATVFQDQASTITTVVPPSETSAAITPVPTNSFLHNKVLSGITFAFVGLIGLVIIIGLTTFTIRRNTKRKVAALETSISFQSALNSRGSEGHDWRGSTEKGSFGHGDSTYGIRRSPTR